MLLDTSDVQTPVFPEHLLKRVGGHANAGLMACDMFRTLCGLKPCDHVLDVGCGIGRIAIPLGKFLNQDTHYAGIDHDEEVISWCQKYITPWRKNFRFHHADIYCPSVNPHGKGAAASYRFPFEDESFDFVFANSVFTHMFPIDVAHYISEIARVMRKGARCYMTYFLVFDHEIGNKKSLVALTGGHRIPLILLDGSNGCFTLDAYNPECFMVHRAASIMRLYKKHDLTIQQPIYRGWWSGAQSNIPCGDNYQDLIIALKE